MEFLKNLNLTPKKIFKILGLIILGLIALSIVLAILSAIFASFRGSGGGMKSVAPMTSSNYYDYDNAGMEESASYSKSVGMQLSVRNVANESTPEDEGAIGGETAQDFEVTEYYGTIETRELEKTCAVISGLKKHDYVIFENSEEDKDSCNYVFKVKSENTAEILKIVESLDPKNLTENVQTIKKLIDDFTSEIEILEKKKEIIESTLNNAINSYDEISKLATNVRDVESLTKIIENKLDIIKRLSDERIIVSDRIERIMRAKAEQLDRLDYTYFRLNIYENKYINWDNIKDSWKQEIKVFFKDVNNILQDVTVNLLKTVLLFLQYFLYFVIIIVAVKIVWKVIKYVWKK